MTTYNNTGLKQLWSLSRHVCHCATIWLSNASFLLRCLGLFGHAMRHSLARVTRNSRTQSQRDNADHKSTDWYLAKLISWYHQDVWCFGAKALGISKAALSCLRMSVSHCLPTLWVCCWYIAWGMKIITITAYFITSFHQCHVISNNNHTDWPYRPCETGSRSVSEGRRRCCRSPWAFACLRWPPGSPQRSQWSLSHRAWKSQRYTQPRGRYAVHGSGWHGSPGHSTERGGKMGAFGWYFEL